MHTTTDADEFARYLKMMNERAHAQAHGSCFLIFETQAPGTPGKNRYVQFSFERRCFCLDMPRETLRRSEAQRILRERSGFFYLRDRPRFTLRGEEVGDTDPFRKVFIYGEERIAAQDTAYIFFQVFRLPSDSPLYVSAASFSGPQQWELGEPI